MSDIPSKLAETAALPSQCGPCDAKLDTIKRRDAEIERLRAAVRWALGEAPDDTGAHFGDVVPPLEAKYWWRTTLRRMAGMGDLAYDKASRIIVDRAHQQGSGHDPRDDFSPENDPYQQGAPEK